MNIYTSPLFFKVIHLLLNIGYNEINTLMNLTIIKRNRPYYYNEINVKTVFQACRNHLVDRQSGGYVL